MTNDRLKSELRNTWEKAAPGWAKWEEIFSAGLRDATETLLDMAGIQAGMRVLDVACGAGSQTIQAAKHVGPNGVVVASDISSTMLKHVQKNAASAGLHNIETVEGAADELESQPAFDAAISRLGLMLFPAPATSLRAVQRVLKPGARFAALVFTTPAHNPFLARTMTILLQHAGKPAPAPGQPGLFALGGDGVLEILMQESGLMDVKTETVRAPLKVANSSDALNMMQEAFGAYRAVVADLGDAEKSSAWRDVHECLKTFETERGFNAEFEFIIGAGAKRRV